MDEFTKKRKDKQIFYAEYGKLIDHTQIENLLNNKNKKLLKSLFTDEAYETKKEEIHKILTLADTATAEEKRATFEMFKDVLLEYGGEEEYLKKQKEFENDSSKFQSIIEMLYKMKGQETCYREAIIAALDDYGLLGLGSDESKEYVNTYIEEFYLPLVDEQKQYQYLFNNLFGRTLLFELLSVKEKDQSNYMIEHYGKDKDPLQKEIDGYIDEFEKNMEQHTKGFKESGITYISEYSKYLHELSKKSSLSDEEIDVIRDYLIIRIEHISVSVNKKERERKAFIATKDTIKKYDPLITSFIVEKDVPEKFKELKKEIVEVKDVVAQIETTSISDKIELKPNKGK